MGRRAVSRGIRAFKIDAGFLSMIVLAFFFLLGAVLACLCSGRRDASVDAAFKGYFDDYCAFFFEGETTVSFWQCVLLYFGPVFAAFLFGFSSLGVILTPAFSAAMGFASSYTVCCFVQNLGRDAVFLALSLLFVRLIITLPCFFAVAGTSFPTSFRLAVLTARRGRNADFLHYDNGYFFRFLLCLPLLAIGVCLELFLTPALFRMAISEFMSF